MKKLLVSLLLAISMVLSFLPVLVSADTLYENFTVEAGNGSIKFSEETAQTFTPSVSHYVGRVDLNLWKVGSPGTLTIGIASTSSGIPASTNLVEINYDATGLPTSFGSWTTFNFPNPVYVVSGNQYAITMALSTDEPNHVQWEGDTVDSTYSGGMRFYSTNHGTTWIGQSGIDVDFREYSVEDEVGVTTDSVLSVIVNGEVVTAFSGNITDVPGDIASLRGFQIGTSSGNYNNALRLSQLASSDNSTGWDGSEGGYALISKVLLPNTTYYYRAFAEKFATPGIQTIGYGAEKSFTTPSYTGVLLPVVSTEGAGIIEGRIYITVRVISSPSAPLASAGARYGTGASADNITWYGSLEQIANHIGSYSIGITINPNIAWGSTVWAQGYATDVQNNIGYGNVVSTIVPIQNVGAGGLFVTNTSATVSGNSVTLKATITNPASVPIIRWAISWGVTSFANDQSFQSPVSGINPTTLTYVVSNLQSSTAYYWKAGVYAQNEWTFSQPTVFTTGSTLPFPVGGMPSVTTLAGSNIGTNFFTANGWLNGIGNASVTQLGFAWSTSTDTLPDTWATSLVSGNFSIGAFSQVLSFSQTGIRIYYTAVAVNQYGISYGSVFFANLSGYNSDNTTPSSGRSINPTQWIFDYLARYGLNNPLGRWGLVIIFMVIGFIAFFQSKILRIVVPLMVFGLGLVAGFLEWWIILLLAIVFGGIVVAIFKKTQG